MEAVIRWNGLPGMSFTAQTGSGHLVNMDGAPDGGGQNLAPRPMELVLSGTGACTAYDVVLILRKSGQDVRNCEVRMSAERREEAPKVLQKSIFILLSPGVVSNQTWWIGQSNCHTKNTVRLPPCSKRRRSWYLHMKLLTIWQLPQKVSDRVFCPRFCVPRWSLPWPWISSQT